MTRNTAARPLLAVLWLATTATPAFAQTPAATQAKPDAPIERVKLTDGELSCRQMHTEMGDMDKAVADARKAQESASTTKTAGQVGGVAAEVANRTGLFGQIGGLFGQIAGSVAAKGAAGVAEQSGQQAAQRAAEREKQALARKEHLASIFVTRGCRASDPDAAPANPTAAIPALAAASAQAALAAMPADEFVRQLANPAPLPGKLDFNRHAININTAKRVMVPTFRVAFAVKTQASAYAGGGLANIGQSTGFGRSITQAQNKRVEMAIAGADLPLLQALTNRIHADFMERLRESGREIVPLEDMVKTPGWSRIKQVTASPYTTSPSGDPREYIVMAPKDMPFFFINTDRHVGNVSGLDQENIKAIQEVAARLDAIVYMPTLLVDIAELESSGRSTFRAGAEADVHPKLGVGWMSSLSLITGKDAKIFFTGEFGQVLVQKPLYADGEYGSVATVENFDTASLANALTRATGLQGAQHFIDKRELRVDRQKFAAGVLNVGATFNQQAIAAAKP